MKLPFTIFILFVLTASFVKKHSNPIKNNAFSHRKDSVFVFRNIKNIDFLDTMTLDHFVKGHYQELTYKEKVRFLSCLNQNNDGMLLSKNWLKSDIDAFIVAKQSKREEFVPTIIKLFGTDYTGLIMANIKENGRLISAYPIWSFENSGPEVYEDTLIITRPKYKCTFSENLIFTEISFGTVYVDTVSDYDLYFIHTKYYTTKIDEKGQFTTALIDSSSTEQPFELSDFNSY